MSRGGGWLTVGILLVVGSLCGGAMIRQSAISAIKEGRGFEDTAQKMNTLRGVATLANVAFYGGIVVGIVGIVLLVVDSGRQDQPSAPYSQSPPYAPPPGRSLKEEENQQLREEVERLRRQRAEEENRELREEVERLKQGREGGASSTAPAAGDEKEGIQDK